MPTDQLPTLPPETRTPKALNFSYDTLRVRGDDDERPIALGDNVFRIPGGLMEDGQLLRKVRLRPFTGHDEEALGTAEARKSNCRRTDICLSRTIEEIEGIRDQNVIERLVPRMLTGDRTALLFMLQKISEHDEVPVTITCRSCDHMWTYQFNLDHLQYDIYGDDPPPTEIHGRLLVGFTDEGALHRDAVLRLLTGEDERRIPENESSLGALRTAMLLQACVRLGKIEEVTEYHIRGMLKKDRTYLAELQAHYNPGPYRFYNLRCENCNRQAVVLVSPEDFFGP